MGRDEARSRELGSHDWDGKWNARWAKAQVQKEGRGSRTLCILSTGGMAQNWLAGSKCVIAVDDASLKVCL